MIIYIIAIISILLVFWLQYPYIKDCKDKPTWFNIYNKIKIPIVVICLIIISYFLFNVPVTSNSVPLLETNINKDLDLNLDISHY